MTKEQQKKKKKKGGGFFYKIYSAYHQELHKIADLKDDVKILKYDILTRQSELSGKGRQSNVEKYVKESESELGIATQPPFLIE